MMSPSTSSTRPSIRVDVPRALAPLLKPARYKGAYGGRGGAKSHFFAEQIIVRCYAKPMRIVCIREVQKSIKDSVKQLLIDKIAKLGLGKYFEVLETEIRGSNGSLIIFRGMQSYNSDTIKSLEGYDIAWVEEAQTLSAVSLELLRPTIRKEDSEIWFSWNPRHRTDPVDGFFRKNPHPEAVSLMVNWRDNPWFPEVLRREMEHDKIVDPDTAEHVWEGGYGLQAGAILGRWISAAEKENRIHDGVSYEASGPGIEISSDLGFRDTASWWFWQRRIGGFGVLAYEGDSGMEAADWIGRIQDTLDRHSWKLGKIWLPHDATNKAFLSKHSAFEQFVAAFGVTKCGIVPRTLVANRINAARTIIKRCEFHASDCEKGLDGLRAWCYDYNTDLQVFTREPLHDWACFVAGTKVRTPAGQRNIEEIAQGDLVDTPTGPRPVDGVFCYRAFSIVEITLSDGRKVLCTGNHKFFTSSGMVAAGALSYGDVLFTGDERIWQLISWISKAAGITGIHAAISGSSRHASSGARVSRTGNCTGTFGKQPTGLFRRVAKSITSTATRATMLSRTCNALAVQIIRHCTVPKTASGLLDGIGPTPAGSSTHVWRASNGKTTPMECGRDHGPRLERHRTLPRHGTAAQMDESGIQNTQDAYGPIGLSLRSLAKFAVRLFLRIGRVRNTAGRIVQLRRLDVDAKVYDLNVRGEHCFIANGVLTSNSHPGDGFSYGCQVMQGLTPPPPAAVEKKIEADPITLNQIMERRERRSKNRIDRI